MVEYLKNETGPSQYGVKDHTKVFNKKECTRFDTNWKLENVLKPQELFRPPIKSYGSIDFTLT